MDLVTFGVHIVCAVLIIAAITFWVWKPTGDFIENNRKKLERDKEELIVNTKETRYFLGLLKQEKTRLTTTRIKIETDARAEATRIIHRARKIARDYEDNMRRETDAKIHQMEEKAKAKLNGVVRELAVELTEKLLEANINDETNKAIVDSYLKELEKKRIASERI